MKILQIHKYFSKKRGAGSVTAFFEIIKLLEKNKHQVSIFSMQDKDNKKSRFNKYFASHFDLNQKMSFWEKARAAFKLIYNFEARRKLEQLLQKEKPEIAHLHNVYHYLSFSIVDSLRKYKIPTIMTLHAYKLICPNYKLFSNNAICEKCKGGKYYNCFLNKCIKKSFISSFVVMLEAYFKKIFKTYDKIDLFIAPSEFMKNKCVEFGISAKKIEVIRNPFNFEQLENNNLYEEEKYFLYYGRLSEEKGIKDLINAIEKLVKSGKIGDNKLIIVGKGPQEKELKQLVKVKNLEKKILFVGFRKGPELNNIIFKAKFIVIPSIWYDNSPMVIVESQFIKKAVIVSDLGGAKESIIDKVTGLVFRGGDVDDLAEKIQLMLTFDKGRRMNMGRRGQDNIKKMFNEQDIYEKILKVYTKLVSKNKDF